MGKKETAVQKDKCKNNPSLRTSLKGTTSCPHQFYLHCWLSLNKSKRVACSIYNDMEVNRGVRVLREGCGGESTGWATSVLPHAFSMHFT